MSKETSATTKDSLPLVRNVKPDQISARDAIPTRAEMEQIIRPEKGKDEHVATSNSTSLTQSPQQPGPQGKSEGSKKSKKHDSQKKSEESKKEVAKAESKAVVIKGWDDDEGHAEETKKAPNSGTKAGADSQYITESTSSTKDQKSEIISEIVKPVSPPERKAVRC